MASASEAGKTIFPNLISGGCYIIPKSSLCANDCYSAALRGLPPPWVLRLAAIAR
jgi:hypothetical protein